MNSRPPTREFRFLYLAGAVLALGGAFATYVLTDRTDDYFAWPIAPEITAAFLGACYISAAALLYLSSRAKTWVEARIPPAPVFLISVLLLAATLIHWDRFDQDHVGFWLWLAAYALVPPALVVLVRGQLREPGEDPPRARPLPGWIRAGLALQGAVMLAVGAVLYFAPGLAEDFWPWALTDLTSQAVGAFTIGFGVVAALAVHENDFDRVRLPAISYAVLSVAVLIAVARYWDELDHGLAGWVFIGFTVSALLVAVASLALGQGSQPARS